MGEIEKNLEIINQYQKEIVLFDKIISLLTWDEETHMPKEGIGTRAEKISFISRLAHEKMTSDELFNACRFLEGKLKGDEMIMLERLFHELKKSRKLPNEFVEELSKTTVLSSHAWKEAKQKKDFTLFKEHLRKIIELKRKESKYKGFKGHPYNALLEDYERGMTEDKLIKSFSILKKGLIELLGKIESSEKYKNQKINILNKKFNEDKQIELARDVFSRMNLSDKVSRIDFAEHPFSSTVGINDVRITTNIRKDPMFSFHSTIHEAGHALYDLNKPGEHFYNVLWVEPSYGIHESQSRFWENCIGKSKAFWKFYYLKFNEIFNMNGTFDEWYREVNIVKPSLIRIESDEVHYCLHIILRFEIEMGLIDGSISVDELPSLWNKKMFEYFGIRPENDSDGVLQDVHWSNGYFGYFPTYALGTIYSVQIYKQMKKELIGIEKDIEKGDYSRIVNWLKDKIHKHGKKLLAEDLIKSVCGEGLNVNVFLNYLNEKYSKIYNL